MPSDMAIELLVPVLVVALVTLVARRARGADGDTPRDGHAIRRAFQYLLLYGLAVVVAIGLAGLLGTLLEGATLARSDQTELARDLAFTVVGVPLFADVALWSRRTLARDPAEARSLAWAAYVTAASLTCVAVAATGVESILRWAVGLQGYSGLAPTQVLVWGGMWAAHRWIDTRVTPPRHALVHRLAGSLMGSGDRRDGAERAPRWNAPCSVAGGRGHAARQRGQPDPAGVWSPPRRARWCGVVGLLGALRGALRTSPPPRIRRPGTPPPPGAR